MAQQVGAKFTENVRIRLKRLDQEMQSRLLDHMRKSAHDIKDLAKLNVPVKDKSVENAIVVEEFRKGINGAFVFDVGVDRRKVQQSREALGKSSTYDYYDLWLHESTYNLGKASEVKNSASIAANPKARVGNKYLTRALISLEEEIEKKARLIADRVIRRANKQ